MNLQNFIAGKNLSTTDFCDINVTDYWQPIVICNSIFGTLNLSQMTYKSDLLIENTIFKDAFYFVSCFPEKPVIIRNCIFEGAFICEFTAFINNFTFIENICLNDFHFNDCNFYGQTHIENNILRKGTDIFDYDGQPDENTFHNIPFIENNIGLQKRNTGIL